MINYHRHSHYSNIILPDSVVTNEDYAKRTVELGQSLLFSTEHGTQGNYRECYDLAKKYNLRWRYAAEAYFVTDRLSQDRTNAHIILAAKTEKGMYDLNETLSEAMISGYYYRPRVDLDLLMSLDPKDVFITTACVAGVWAYGWDKENQRYDWSEPDRLVRILRDHFKDSFMLEVQYHDVGRQKVVNEHILKLYREEGIPLICGLDSHYIYPEQESLRTDFLASKHLVYEDEAGWFMDYPDEDTVFKRFKAQGVLSDAQITEAMDNTSVALDWEDIEFSKGRKLPTLYPELTQEERNEKYRQLIRDKWREYRVNVPKEEWPKYLQGIQYEVDTITDTDTSDYFLLSYDFVRHYKELGGQITKTGRGSAPSYFSNMLLGLSSIDRFRIPVTMYPDRFVSRERLKTSMPDIDNNLSDQPLAAKALADVMGEWHSAQMVAYGTLKRLSAWKMYCRATNVDFETANKISDELKRYELDVKHADEDERDAINVFDYVPPEYHEQLRMSERYLGMIESISPHPCAFLLTQGDIRREIGIFRLNAKSGKKGVTYAAFIDGATADGYGYLKEDLLVVDVVKVNADIYNRIGMEQPPVPKLMEMVANDKATWQMYAKGWTLGLNQAEKEKSTEKVMRYKPRNLSEMSAFVAGIRPAFQSMLGKLLAREHFDYGIPALDALLQTPEMPSSFVLYQEQMMGVLQYAGFTAPESYAAIKAIAKKHPEKVLPLKEKFLTGFKAKLMEKGTEEKTASDTSDQVWTIISDACGYGFNSSHSVAVALDSLYTAWAKAHYPLETYTALMANYAEKGDKDRIDRARQEMKKAFGIRIVQPRFGQDNRDYFIDHENKTISDSLVSIKHVSKTAANALYRLGQHHYNTFIDLLYDMTMEPALNTRVIEILIRLSYFADFGGTAKLLSVFHEFIEGEHKFSKSHIEKTQRQRLDELRAIENATPDSEIPVEDKVAFELTVLGTPVTVDPTAKGVFAVLDVDTKYSPKVLLYNVASGTTGRMKVRKPVFNMKPLEVGAMLQMKAWKQKPAMQFIDGKAIPKPGVFDLWLDDYSVLRQPTAGAA